MKKRKISWKKVEEGTRTRKREKTRFGFDITVLCYKYKHYLDGNLLCLCIYMVLDGGKR
jgi:hypothetical protein